MPDKPSAMDFMVEEKKVREYSDQKSEEFAKVRDSWREKWLLSLAIGNGTALLTLLSVLGDSTKRTTETIIPTYFFLLGLICAAVLRIFQSQRADREADLYWGLARQSGGKGFTIKVDGKSMTGDEFVASARRSRSFWMKAAYWTEVASAGAFVVGCMVGLVIVSIKASGGPHCL